MPDIDEPKDLATVTEVNLPPHWPNLLRWWAHQMSSHSFNPGALSPVISFIEQIRYLSLTDPEEVNRILEELKETAQMRGEHLA